MNSLLWIVLIFAATYLLAFVAGVGFTKAKLWIVTRAFRNHQTQE